MPPLNLSIARDGLAPLYPASADRLTVGWNDVCVPGPPTAFALTPDELEHPDPEVRYERRLVQAIDADGERFALVDKASPHALHDLMISAVHRPPRPAPPDSPSAGGRLLWRTGARFAEFVSRPATMREFDLAGGYLHLALNCDPNTRDRESCQANKQLHLHLLYWTPRELTPLSRARPLAEITDVRLRRQALDPLAFVGARLLHDALGDVAFGIPGAALVPTREPDAISGRLPLGCLIRLPGWGVLDLPEFDDLVRRVHLSIEQAGALVLEAFTGEREPPTPWIRHRLLPRSRILANVRRLPWSAPVRDGLTLLAERLRDLDPALARRLRFGSPARRRHHMSLNLPCYSLNLYAPVANVPGRPLAEATPIYLILQTKLFSGIGGAGLVSLADVPSVRILRGLGSFREEQWTARARFQRAFAEFNARRLAGSPGLEFHPVRRFVGVEHGWRDH